VGQKAVILDANVVIKLHELGIWQQVCQRCDIYLAETVLSESLYYWDGAKRQQRIDEQTLRQQVRYVFHATPADVQDFLSCFRTDYQERLDPGELESLCWLVNGKNLPSDLYICSSDAIVFRVLGWLNRGDQGISLEELLQSIGLQKRLEPHFGRNFKDRHAQQGKTDFIQS